MKFIAIYYDVWWFLHHLQIIFFYEIRWNIIISFVSFLQSFVFDFFSQFLTTTNKKSTMTLFAKDFRLFKILSISFSLSLIRSNVNKKNHVLFCSFHFITKKNMTWHRFSIVKSMLEKNYFSLVFDYRFTFFFCSGSLFLFSFTFLFWYHSISFFLYICCLFFLRIFSFARFILFSFKLIVDQWWWWRFFLLWRWCVWLIGW